jgi:PKD repeat protein
MAHNGGLSQVVPWFPNSAADYPWLNILKINNGWALYQASSGRTQPNPTYFNEYGYPSSLEVAGGVKCQVGVPSQTYRPGYWVVKWTGYADIKCENGATVVSGTTPDTDGRLVISVSGSGFQLRVNAVNIGIAPLTNIAVVHADDESLYDGGQIFGVQFLAKMREANFGVVRFLDWQHANVSRLALWANRKPENYFSYVCDEYRASAYAGETTNVGNAYSLTLPGFVLEQGATAIFRLNTAPSGTATMDISGTGAKTIVGLYAAAYTPTSDQVNAYSTVTYDEYLDQYIMAPGSFAAGGTGGKFLNNYCPIEICVALANELNAHPWFHIPYLAVDPMTDFTTELATYVKNNLNAGLVPRFELINEIWNTAAGFNASRLAWAKSEARWGVAFDGANWQGMCGATMGEAVSAVYADDRTKYQTITGLQTFGGTNPPDSVLAATKWVLDGGDPASDWITHIAVANYWCPRYWEHVNRSTTEELAWAYEYNTATAERKAEILEEYVSTGITENVNQTPARFVALVTSKQAWAQGLGVNGLTAYEGGYSPDYTTVSGFTRTITGVTQAAQAVCTLSTTGSVNGLPPAGATVTISGIGGMTELNGNTYTVVSSTGNTMTLNVDSTGFTAFSSNGTATYVNSATLVTTLRRASKFTPAVETYELQTYNDFVDLGGEYPSCYMLSGYQLWSVWDPSIYEDTPSTRWDAILAFNSVSAPGADFSATPLSGTTPLSVTFTDESTGSPTSWLWERNDGSGWATFSTSENPTESFTTGTWSVRLTATNANGSNTASQTDYIVVSAVSEPDPVIDPIPGGKGRGKKKDSTRFLTAP